jgi:hypothetical protein
VVAQPVQHVVGSVVQVIAFELVSERIHNGGVQVIVFVFGLGHIGRLRDTPASIAKRTRVPEFPVGAYGRKGRRHSFSPYGSPLVSSNGKQPAQKRAELIEPAAPMAK